MSGEDKRDLAALVKARWSVLGDPTRHTGRLELARDPGSAVLIADHEAREGDEVRLEVLDTSGSRSASPT